MRPSALTVLDRFCLFSNLSRNSAGRSLAPTPIPRAVRSYARAETPSTRQEKVQALWARFEKRRLAQFKFQPGASEQKCEELTLAPLLPFFSLFSRPCCFLPTPYPWRAAPRSCASSPATASTPWRMTSGCGWRGPIWWSSQRRLHLSSQDRPASRRTPDPQARDGRLQRMAPVLDAIHPQQFVRVSLACQPWRLEEAVRCHRGRTWGATSADTQVAERTPASPLAQFV